MPFADDVMEKLRAGQRATARGLRALADEIDDLPLDRATEALTWLSPHVANLRAETERILRGWAGKSQQK